MSYVWCTLVMLGDSYAKGAAVVAHSLRKTKSKYPIWCAVTEDVSQMCVDTLISIFDNVVTVPLLSHDVVPYRSPKQASIYNRWINYSFTKWNICNPGLFPVDKVILVDADMLFLHNCDELFELPGNAMTFSSPWAEPYHNVRPMRNPYGTLSHGAKIKHSSIKKGLKNSIVGLACMILILPSNELLVEMTSLLSRDAPFNNGSCKSGYDEIFGALLMINTNSDVYHIHQKYNWIVGKTAWIPNDYPRTQQYYNMKPWNESPDVTIWDDVKQWWEYANELRGINSKYDAFMTV